MSRSPLDIARWMFRLLAAAGPLCAGIAGVGALRGLEWLRTACLQIGDLGSVAPATAGAYVFVVAPWAAILLTQLGTIQRRSRIAIAMDVLRALALAAAVPSAQVAWHYNFTPQPIAHVSCDWELWRDFAETYCPWQFVVVCPLAGLTLLAALAEFVMRKRRSGPNEQ